MQVTAKAAASQKKTAAQNAATAAERRDKCPCVRKAPQTAKRLRPCRVSPKTPESPPQSARRPADATGRAEKDEVLSAATRAEKAADRE